MTLQGSEPEDTLAGAVMEAVRRVRADDRLHDAHLNSPFRQRLLREHLEGTANYHGVQFEALRLKLISMLSENHAP